MYCKTQRSRIRELIGALMLPIFALITPRTGAAQEVAAQDTAPLTLLVVIFPDTTAANDAMAKLQASASKPAADTETAQPNTVGRPVDGDWIEPYFAVASKDRSGKVQVQHHGTKGDTPRDRRAAQTIDGIAALLGQRPSENGHAGAAGAGATRAGISSADARELQQALGPGETALIIVVEHPAAPWVTSGLRAAGATEVYDAAMIPPAK